MAVTLVALSNLVPILGGATVIGGKRLRLFNDGRPAAVTKHISHPIQRTTSSISRTEQELPERLSPDGGEDEIAIPENNTIIPDEDLDSWSDWDHEETINQSAQENSEQLQSEINLTELQTSNVLRLGEKVLPRSPEINTDILRLDIKSQKDSLDSQELDFFSDMEPVIEKTSKVFIDGKNDVNNINLAMTNAEDNLIDEECWGDDLSWVKN